MASLSLYRFEASGNNIGGANETGPGEAYRTHLVSEPRVRLSLSLLHYENEQA